MPAAQKSLNQSVESLLELEQGVWESLVIAKLENRTSLEDVDPVVTGLERALTEVKLIRSRLDQFAPIPTKPTPSLQPKRNLIYRVITSYYSSPWISVDVPASVNPFAILLTRPAELLYSIIAFVSFYSFANYWLAFGAMLMATLSSFQTTQLRQAVVNHTGPKHLLTSILLLMLFRQAILQSCLYFLSTVQPSQQLNKQWYWSWFQIATRYYSSTSATILAVIIGICVGF